jgi:hypothetical protein
VSADERVRGRACPRTGVNADGPLCGTNYVSLVGGQGEEGLGKTNKKFRSPPRPSRSPSCPRRRRGSLADRPRARRPHSKPSYKRLHYSSSPSGPQITPPTRREREQITPPARIHVPISAPLFCEALLQAYEPGAARPVGVAPPAASIGTALLMKQTVCAGRLSETPHASAPDGHVATQPRGGQRCFSTPVRVAPACNGESATPLRQCDRVLRRSPAR